MNKTTFSEYFSRRMKNHVLVIEMDEKGGTADKAKTPGVSSNVVLGKDNDFKPFIVAGDTRTPGYPANRNLAPIIQAFLDSSKVKVYNSLDAKGEHKPHTLGTKKLFMVGGAVRDHLKGRTPHDIDLATDATPDEIRMILNDAGFKETDAQKSDGKTRSTDEHGPKIFYVKGRDKTGTDFTFGVKVNGQEFDLSTFRADSKGSDGRHPDQMKFSSHQDDSARRDLTINSLYLALNNPDGPNANITDHHGGIHDLASDTVKFVGNPQERLEEDLLRALRYIRFAAREGKGKVQDEIKTAIKKVAPNIRKAVSAERIQEEFSKGLAYEEVEPSLYIKLYKDMGLLDVVFPGMKIKLDSPEDYPKDRDKSVVIASLLRGNDPQEIQKCLVEGKWSSQDIKRVLFLHKILELHPHLSSQELEKYLVQYQGSGINPETMKSWWDGNKKGNKELLKSFTDYAGGPRVKAVSPGEDGRDSVHPNFADLFDTTGDKPRPMQGFHPSGMPFAHLVGARKSGMEHQNWQKIYQQLQPRARRNVEPE